LSPHELAVQFAELELQRRRVEAALVAVVGEADRSGAFRVDGHASVAGWCRALGRWSDTEATRRRQVADLAAVSEGFTAAVASGAIGVVQAGELARTFANPRCGAGLVDDLDAFVARADRVPFREFRDRLAQWVIVHDADGAHRDVDYSHTNRDAQFAVFDGIVHGEVRGGAADGTVIVEIWERFRDAEFAADWDATVARFGDDAAFSLMPRTDAQRRFDALTAIFQRAATTTPADARTPEPLVNLIIDLHTLDELLNTTPTLSTSCDVWDRRCATTDGTPLAPAEIVSAMWWGRTRAVIVDDHGTIVGMGRTRRLFTGRLRDAVLLRSERCVWPGCNLPTRRCQADHLHEHRHGGRTDPDNGAPACGRHNRFKTHGYTVHRGPDGTWHTHRPDGTEIH
jgi:hypothetical protein